MNSPKLTGLGIHEQTILTLITAHHPPPAGRQLYRVLFGRFGERWQSIPVPK